MQPDAVGRIGEQQTRFGGRGTGEDVDLLEREPFFDTSGRGIAARAIESLTVEIACDYRNVCRFAHAIACALANPLPRRPVEPGELLKPERTREPRRAVGGKRRCLD